MAKPSSVPKIRTDLAYYGVVTRVISATQFMAAGLAGLGDGALVNYAAYVMAKANGTVTPPHAEQPAVTAYVSSSGTFTHAAYTAPLAVGDRMLLLHPNIAGVAGIAADIATLLTRLTALRAGYLDELDFDLQGTLATIAAYIDTEVAVIQLSTDRLAGDEIVATHNHANNVAWQTVVTIDPAGLRRKIHSIWLNFVNLTQNTIYRLSYNYGGLGYEVFDSNAADPWTPAMDNGVIIAVNSVIAHELRLEIQSQVLEGAARDVPYEVYFEDME